MYRLNTGIVLFNKEGKVFVCDRKDTTEASWQFPQGGMDAGETPLQTAQRELFEETGIKNIKVIAQTQKPIRYDFPPSILEKFKKLGRQNIGQEQYWVLAFYEGDLSEIDFSVNPQEIEFTRFQWVDFAVAVDGIVDFKKDVYRKVEKEFSPLIQKFLSDNKF